MTEHDELEESIDGSMSEIQNSSPPEPDLNQAAASRRRAMKEKAAERDAEEATKSAKVAKDRSDARVKKAEGKQVAAERQRISDEEEVYTSQLRALEHKFRSYLYTLRARPIGSDRFGNKVWWLDGSGSAPLIAEGGKTTWGTGRLYVQGAEDAEVMWCRLPTEVPESEVEARRVRDEGEGRLAPGEWGSYETTEQVCGTRTLVTRLWSELTGDSCTNSSHGSTRGVSENPNYSNSCVSGSQRSRRASTDDGSPRAWRWFLRWRSPRGGRGRRGRWLRPAERRRGWGIWAGG